MKNIKKEKAKVVKKTEKEIKAKKPVKLKPAKPAAKPKKLKATLAKPAAKESGAKPVKTEVKKPAKPALKLSAKKQEPVFTPQAAHEVAPHPPTSETISPAKETKKEVEEIKITAPAAKPEFKPELKEIELKLPITLKDLAIRLQQKPSLLIKNLMDMRVMAGINQALEEQLVVTLCAKFGFKIIRAPEEEELALKIHTQADPPEFLCPRFPIVTFMGHVDHGKTSLLDAIRKTKVAESEHGGITQHIGAYRVVLPKGEITFLDTPGHEAFTAMRARGASVTDIVVLVVAADDGVMPQTQEAIDHARAAGVSIIVAVNKIDKSQADMDMVKKQLSQRDLRAEDWGGKIITVGVSAKTGQGIDELLEMILLEAQMLELKANPQKAAKGVVLEAKMSQGRGSVATLLVQDGTLHLNDNVIVGNHYGKIRAMFNDRGLAVTEALPSFPVEVLGLSGVPAAGEQFFVIKEERIAKELILKRQEKEKLQQVKTVKRISLEDLHAQIKEGKIKELKIIIKSDVQGSLGAIKDTLAKINTSEIKLDIIHEGVGAINSSDVVLAVASNALILGFHVEADEPAKEIISKEGIDVRIYNVIYELANDIKAALEGMLEPKLKKIFLGRAEVKKVFKLSRSGTVAGCMVNKGKITRNALVNIVRNAEPIFEGRIAALKRFKDDVKEVAEGFECGISLSGFDNLAEGDSIEAYEIEKILRKL